MCNSSVAALLVVTALKVRFPFVRKIDFSVEFHAKWKCQTSRIVPHWIFCSLTVEKLTNYLTLLENSPSCCIIRPLRFCLTNNTNNLCFCFVWFLGLKSVFYCRQVHQDGMLHIWHEIVCFKIRLLNIRICQTHTNCTASLLNFGFIHFILNWNEIRF